MSQVLSALSLWLHTLATVVMIGYYLQLSLVFMPCLGKELTGVAPLAALGALARRMRPWLGVALLFFLLSGGFLTLADNYYPGFGQLLANTWTILMVAKHLVVLAMVAAAMYLNGILQRAESPSTEPSSFGRARFAVHALSAMGVLVLLLTALAEVQ